MFNFYCNQGCVNSNKWKKSTLGVRGLALYVYESYEFGKSIIGKMCWGLITFRFCEIDCTLLYNIYEIWWWPWLSNFKLAHLKILSGGRVRAVLLFFGLWKVKNWKELVSHAHRPYLGVSTQQSLFYNIIICIQAKCPFSNQLCYAPVETECKHQEFKCFCVSCYFHRNQMLSWDMQTKS